MKFRNPEVEKQVALYCNLQTGNRNMFLFGPPGTGKTMLVKQIAKSFGYKLFRITGRETLQDVNMIGSNVIRPDQSIIWVDGPLSKAFKVAGSGEKTIMFIDELNRMPTRHQNIFIEIINSYDDDNYYLINYDTGETLSAPIDNLLFIAAGNMGQAGTSHIPEALKDRFNFVYVNYPPPDIEREILIESGLSEKFINIAIELAENTREQFENMELEAPISTRTLVNIARHFDSACQVFPKLKEDIEAQKRVFKMLFKSSLMLCVGAGETPDWKERLNGLLTLLDSIVDNSLPSMKRKKKQERTANSIPTAGPVAI